MLHAVVHLSCCCWSVLAVSLPRTPRQDNVVNRLPREAEPVPSPPTAPSSPPSSACPAGKRPPDCQADCHDGTFGSNCSFICNCLASRSCNVTTGRCPDTCAAGFEGEDCLSPCKPGLFGLNCLFACQCANHSRHCDHVTGHCTAGCGPRGRDCSVSCVKGRYGPDCSKTCGHCHNGECHPTTGQCPGGCETGWTSDDCKTPCLVGMYGENCQHLCGRCAGGAPCNVSNGLCPAGCEAGYMMPFCRHQCRSEGVCWEDCSGQECWQNTHTSSLPNKRLVLILVPALGLLFVVLLVVQFLCYTHRHFLRSLLLSYRVHRSFRSVYGGARYRHSCAPHVKCFPSESSLDVHSKDTNPEGSAGQSDSGAIQLPGKEVLRHEPEDKDTSHGARQESQNDSLNYKPARETNSDNRTSKTPSGDPTATPGW